MRKTNVALLVAAVMVSPLALATGDLDVSATDMFNTDVTIEKTDSFNKTATVNDSFKSDDDFLLMKDIGNKDVDVDIHGSFNDTLLKDNSTYDESHTYSIDIDIDEYLAETELEGEIEDSTVTYGGACCDDNKHGDYRGHGDSNSGSGYVKVYQTNTMNGAFGGASGINVAGQNVGNNSLVQQAASTNAALVGK
ncbi:hypothetical protein L4D76_14770 [Photobacterium sagamiensis]|uniref:hypothetical protein n=1 Tax=Photobacterium sagamiensis TaxID=2910241 RepID=UPI003D0ADAAC